MIVASWSRSHGGNQISTTKTAIWITPEASSVEYPVTVSFQNTCIHSLYSIIMFFTFFLYNRRFSFRRSETRLVKSHRRNWHAWTIKVNWWTLAHLHAGLAVGLLDTFFLLSSEMRYPLCWCVFAQGKIGERCKYKYDHGIQMNYFSFNLYNVYRNYLDWQQLDLTAIIFIIRNIGQP